MSSYLSLFIIHDTAQDQLQNDPFKYNNAVPRYVCDYDTILRTNYVPVIPYAVIIDLQFEFFFDFPHLVEWHEIAIVHR